MNKNYIEKRLTKEEVEQMKARAVSCDWYSEPQIEDILEALDRLEIFQDAREKRKRMNKIISDNRKIEASRIYREKQKELTI